MVSAWLVSQAAASLFRQFPDLLAKATDGLEKAFDAQLRGIGGGFLPEYLARPHVNTGRLVEKKMQRASRLVPMSYAWRRPENHSEGPALKWWLEQLNSPATRKALLDREQSL